MPCHGIGGPLAYYRYLGLIAAAFSVVTLLYGTAVLSTVRSTGELNDFAIPLNGDSSWYRDFGGRTVPELQEDDIFYHAIGSSIAYAKKADIILLGPSFVLYALDPELLRQFGERHHLKIYNMALFGVRSGEFSRRIVKRARLRPRLWVINVDDQFEHFFSSQADIWGFGGSAATPIPAVEYGRAHGWFAVSRRNLRWRLEDLRAKITAPGPLSDGAVYRRYDDGSVYLDHDPRYRAAGNTPITVVRDPNCHADPATIAEGKRYLADIGSQTILTLVPTSTYCPQQARELGEALGVNVLLPPTSDYTTVDGGGHLDHNGAVAFTKFFLSALERSDTYRRIWSH